MKKIIAALLVLVLVGASVFAEGQGETESAEESNPFAWVEEMGEGELPAVNPLLVQGDVATAGSSTVAPLAAVIIERYKEDGLTSQVTLDVIGSGAGFERFTVAGETDVSNASRAIKDSEVENAAEIGRTPIPFRVGTDALSVVVSQENDFVEDVTAEELALIFGGAETWNEVRSDWPNEPILRYVPGTDSGTFDFFVEMVYDEDPDTILSAENTQFSEDDNILVQGVSESPYAVAFFGYAYFVENQDILKILSVEGIEPSQEAVENANYDSIEKNVEAGGYPIARPLFIYSDAEIMRSKPQVAAYIAYFLNNVNDVIDQVGYFPADLSVAEANWLEAMEGAY
ncbi:phosphate ABC transporter substrate-binding protein PstS family protein [Salinispira pacifica]|uniref:Phosphate-binding protein n=1 Tax=Salinispira pacifica TaxID=1307761 RepID=V5WE29_9SPIO|nr:phosphate ABC transporter substrate-binding protein PstS family protein [Salinispira pacifica]AHC13895.1 Phosphate ABC transporter, periplasmic phosphate-binding protein PstS [Salinispira pacifica]